MRESSTSACRALSSEGWSPSACDALAPFRLYLVLHNGLLLLRFWGDQSGGMPWIVSTVVMNKMLLDLAHQQHKQWQMRQVRLEDIAHETTKRLFERFCDATVTVDADLQISQQVRLAPMLGMQDSSMCGRQLTSIIDKSDLESFVEHMQLVAKESDKAPNELEKPDSFQVKLIDSFAQPVLVHLFHSTLGSFGGVPKFFIGVSESWRPPKTKGFKTQHKGFLSEKAPEKKSPFRNASPDIDFSIMATSNEDGPSRHRQISIGKIGRRTGSPRRQLSS